MALCVCQMPPVAYWQPLWEPQSRHCCSPEWCYCGIVVANHSLLFFQAENCHASKNCYAEQNAIHFKVRKVIIS